MSKLKAAVTQMEATRAGVDTTDHLTALRHWRLQAALRMLGGVVKASKLPKKVRK